jgi:predicted TIM-barrel fold metal-dependent hydrolase
VVQFHTFANDADQIATIATRYPTMRLIIDHMGYPRVDEPVSAFAPIVELSRFDNIVFKLSDVKGRSKEGFPFCDVHPFIAALLDAFGTERTVWGTGYPGHHRTKHKWLTLADEIRLIREGLPFVSAREAEQILGETAAALWRL